MGLSKMGNSNIAKKYLGTKEVVKEVLNGSVVYSKTPTPTPSVDPILANNSWATIKAVCESGQASNYWSVGDTKTDIGTDNIVRTFRICDMQGLYSKHVVFEQTQREVGGQVWNTSTNTDDNNAYNDYNIANIRTTMNTTIKALYSSDLQSALTQTTVKVAKNGNNGTLVDVTDYLFLPAEKEIFGSASYSRSEEASALTQYQYYATHNTASDRIKQKLDNSGAGYWWLRSPRSSSTSNVCNVSSGGGADNSGAGYMNGVAPCFAF